MRWPLAAAAIGILGCSSGHRAPAPAPAGRPDAARPADANARLDELVRDWLDGTLAASPTTATWLGAHGFDDRLDDTSPEAQAREAVRLRLILARAAALPDGELDATHALDKQLLEREARLALLDLAEARPLERNPVRYVDLVSSGIEELLGRDFAPLPDRLRSIVARLSRVRPLLDDARRNLKNPPEIATRRAIELAQGARAFLAETLPKAVSAVGDDRLLADFRLALADAQRALDDFIAWMQKDLAPRSKGEWALGRDRLIERLRAAEDLALPLDQLLAAAERDLKATRQRVDDLSRVVAPGKSQAEAARLLEDDHPAADELLPAAGAALDQVIAFARDHRLLTLPEARPKVAEMPPFLWGFAGVSSPGPLEQRARDTYFYVDPVDRSWTKRRREEHLRALNRPQLLLTAIHEVAPGHFAQREAARRAPSTMMRVAHGYAFAEGWANYAEMAMIEAGFGAADPKIRLAQARAALVRACRLVAALRLHGFGGKLEDAVKVFADDGYLDDYAARREAERVAHDPACMGPALGKLLIVRLRDEYREAKGEDYEPGELHDRLLARGAAPLGRLRALLLEEPPAAD